MTRFLLTAGLALAALVAVPAAAVPPRPTFEPLAEAAVWVASSTLSGATVCAAGQTTTGTPTNSRWSYRVAGSTTTYTHTGTGGVYPKTCHAFATAGFAAGATVASLEYVGVGGGEPLASCEVVIAWEPGVAPHPLASGCSRTAAAD